MVYFIIKTDTSGTFCYFPLMISENHRYSPTLLTFSHRRIFLISESNKRYLNTSKSQKILFYTLKTHTEYVLIGEF